MSTFLGCLALIGIVACIVIVPAIVIVAMKKSSAQHGTSGSLSAAMTNVESLFHEGKGNVVDAMQATREHEGEESGDPPER